MSIQNKTSNSKGGGSDISFDSLEGGTSIHTTILLLLLLIFSCFSAFALGRLSGMREGRQEAVVVKTIPPDLFGEKEPGKDAEKLGAREPATDTQDAGATFLVGSKNSDKYHFPWCSGALRIKPENLISFTSYEEARAAGYTPAGNCDGLQ